jgi:ATP-dependent Clp protease, protease subunit
MTAFYLSGIIGDGEATADSLAAHLRANPGHADVIINSPGGDAFEGAAMLAEMQRHRAVTVHIQGIAASAASLAAMGGRQIVMHSAAVLMIHEPAAISFGPADRHRQTAATLDGLTDVYAQAYAKASGNPVAMVRQWLADETWLNADQALALNFVDRIEGGADRPVAIAPFDYTMFRNPPAALVRLAIENQWKEKENA